MNPEVVERVAAAYGIEVRQVLEPSAGYRSQVWPIITRSGQQLLVILYKREKDIVARIKRTNAVGNYLASNEMPARQTYDSRILRLKTDLSERYVSVYHYLTGNTLPWEAYTMDHLKLLGWVMSDMHHYLKQAPFALPPVADEYRQIVSRMYSYFSRPVVRVAMQDKLGLTLVSLDHMGEILNDCDQLSDQQVLHMDFVRGNVLFSPTLSNSAHYTLGKYNLSGILDFEKAATGSPIIDVARTLAFLLVDCKYKTEGKVRKYFLASGYGKRGQATLAHIELLEPLVNLFLMYDLYKFLHHNPYESLKDNEHFVRTKLLLIKRRLLTAEGGKIG